MYKDAETSWAIESAPLRKKKKEAPLCQKNRRVYCELVSTWS